MLSRHNAAADRGSKRARLRTRLVLVFAAIVMAATAAPAAAGRDSVDDPTGDVPDILRFTLINRQNAVAMRMKYADLSQVDADSLIIKWRRRFYFVANERKESGGWESELREQDYGHNPVPVRCDDMIVRHVPEKDVTNVRVPRECVEDAPNRIRARGKAWPERGSEKDVTDFTRYVRRG